ncbi:MULTISPECIES: hypothetical protein, partial [unclassified Lysinibacillus]|uniref:hypothetical protein n=1 Tax=unclassified Lysinibacillus TaxID=2636778 RepID=UPI002010F00F
MSRFCCYRYVSTTLSHRKHPLRSRVSGQHDVGHEGVITGCDGFSLRSSIANPQGVAQSPLQSTTSQCMYLLIYNDKTKLQQQMFYVRKRSDSNKCFICAKAKRQQQMFYL